jgi:dTDP-4-dehydrorhamnose 3,5-epimerase
MTPDPGWAPGPSALPGVRFLQHGRHTDSRGSFREIWRASELGPIGAELAEFAGAGDAVGLAASAAFVQANFSVSEAGVLRGLHLHRRQLDYWTVLAGVAFVALVDARPMVEDRADRPLVETRVLTPAEGVVIPAGVAHGFLALEPLQLLYLVTNEYDGSDELGFAWDDPAVGVPWPPVSSTPDGLPILSDRDRANPSLKTLVERLRA